MTDDRREAARRPLFLECSFAREARIVDLAAGGCYVDCRRPPAIGEEVEFTVVLEGQPTTLRGKAVHVKDHVGFAMEFAGLDEEAAARIRRAVSANGADENA